MIFKKSHQAMVILVFIMLFHDCSNARVYQTEYKMKNGRTVIITETHPNGQSLSNIEIKSLDFKYNLSETIHNIDPIKEIIISDLDGNGFDEIYIITVSSGSGSYGNVLAFSSNKDQSLSMINFPDIQKNDKHFDGYMGHDTFIIADQKLTRVFPIYLESDSNNSPTGGKREITYGLYPGEAMWQLKIKKVEQVN